MEISFNKYQTQSFGALIYPKGTKAKFSKIANELKDTQYYNLEITENLTPRIASCFTNSYLPPFTIKKPEGRFLPFSATWDGMESQSFKRGEVKNACITFANSNAAIAAYKKLQKCESELDTAVMLTKMLDAQPKKRPLVNKKK